jgi:ribosomal protein L40E
MIYCIKCGSPNPDSASYCSTCGQDFVDDNHCPKCGKTLPPGAIYCSGCGSNLRELNDPTPLPVVPIYDPTKDDPDFTADTTSYDSDYEEDTSYQADYPEEEAYRHSSFPDDDEEEEEETETKDSLEETAPISHKRNQKKVEDFDDNYDEDDFEEGTGFASRLIIILAIIIVAALLVFGFLYFKGIIGTSKAEPVTASADVSETDTADAKDDTNEDEKEQVEVPDLSGMTYDQAKSTLDALNLGIRATYKNSDTVEKDVIISQSTAAGTKVDAETKIHVDVSKGAAQSVASTESSTDSQTEEEKKAAEEKKAQEQSQSQSQTTDSSSSTSSSSNDSSLFPNIATTALTDSQLASVTDPSTCRQAINELYAREGYIFTDSSIQAYFESQSWYSGVTNDMSAIQSKIYSNSNANYNLDALVNIKSSNGWSW